MKLCLLLLLSLASASQPSLHRSNDNDLRFHPIKLSGKMIFVVDGPLARHQREIVFTHHYRTKSGIQQQDIVIHNCHKFYTGERRVLLYCRMEGGEMVIYKMKSISGQVIKPGA